MGLVSLTTDFGTRDEYVAVMKAVMWRLAPRLQIIDISHQVAPQDRHQAAFLLKAAYPYFDAGSVHVVVVDPGVGSGRRIVAARFDGHYFLFPDNGICGLVLAGGRPEALVVLDRSEFFLPAVSRTFHGRDIFAPVAARLATGTALEEVGTPLAADDLEQLPPPPPPAHGPGWLSGTVVQVDRFGNLTTNIDQEALDTAGVPLGDPRLVVRIGGQSVAGLAACYADAPSGSPVALMGSRGLLEIAVNQGDARQFFDTGRGDAVRMEWGR